MFHTTFSLGRLLLITAALALATPGVGRAQYYARNPGGGGQLYYAYGPNGWYLAGSSLPTHQNYSPYYYNAYPSYSPSQYYYNPQRFSPFAGGVPYYPGGVAPYRSFVGGPQDR